MQIGSQMKAAFTQFIGEVQSGEFPAQEHGFDIEDNIIEKLY